jgi:hypothetical protein
MKIAVFLDELMSDTRLQEEFMRAPRDVMIARRLTEKEQEVMLSGNRDRIAFYVADQIRQFKIRPFMYWGAPGTPEIGSVDPQSGPRGNEDPLPITITGTLVGGNDMHPTGNEGEIKGVSCSLVQGNYHTPKQAMVITDHNVDYPDWELDVDLKIPADAPPGQYDLVITYFDTSDTFPNAFNVLK